MNRLTISLPDDLYAMARAHAVANRKSLSKAIGDLLRQGRTPNPSPAPSGHSQGPKIHPETGFPLIECEEGLTMADIQRAIDDDDIRHLEMMGLGPEEIERALAR